MEENLDSKTKAFINSNKRTATIAIFVILLVGVILKFFLWKTGNGLPEPPNYIVFFQELGNILISTAFATFVATKVQEHTNNSFFREIIAYSLTKIFQPVINHTEENSHSHYRLSWYLSPVDKDDIDKKMIMRHMQKSYKMQHCPRDIRVIYSVSSIDGSLSEFYEDPRYVLRWGEDDDPNIKLDVENSKHFSIPVVRINGEELSFTKNPKKQRLQVPGGKAFQYIFPVKKDTVNQPATLTIDYSVIKYLGDDKKYDIHATLFQYTTDAEINVYDLYPRNWNEKAVGFRRNDK